MKFLRTYSGPLTEGRRFQRGDRPSVRTPKTKPGGKALHPWQIEALRAAGHLSRPEEEGAPKKDTGTDPATEAGE